MNPPTRGERRVRPALDDITEGNVARSLRIDEAGVFLISAEFTGRLEPNDHSGSKLIIMWTRSCVSCVFNVQACLGTNDASSSSSSSLGGPCNHCRVSRLASSTSAFFISLSLRKSLRFFSCLGKYSRPVCFPIRRLLPAFFIVQVHAASIGRETKICLSPCFFPAACCKVPPCLRWIA